MGRVLGDTNLLLRYSRIDDPRHGAVMASLERLSLRGDRIVIASQSLAEFWAVATRPAGSPNGLGYTPAEAKVEVDDLRRTFERLPDSDAAFPIWLDLVSRYGVSGKTTHDAPLVATMLANGVTRVLTFNVRDFARYEAIRAESP